MKQKVMHFAMAAAICLATALGIWSGQPLGEDTAKQLRIAAKFYDDYIEKFDDLVVRIPTGNHTIFSNPIVIKYAPSEAKAAREATDITIESMRRNVRALEALTDKFRRVAAKN